MDSLNTKEYFVNTDEISVTVRTKYDSENDIIFVFGKGGGNGLPDFRKVYTISNKIEFPDISKATVAFIPYVGDMTGPHIMKAVLNGDGDAPDCGIFTGGNHQTNNQGSGGAKTADNASFIAIADEKAVTNGTYCDSVILKWTNNIQAYNTVKLTGNGRSVLKENVEMTLDGCRVEVSISHTALEKIERMRYYGLQLMNGGFSTIKYIGGAEDKEYDANKERSDCGNQTSNSYIVKTSTGETCEVGIYNTGLGNFELCGTMKSVFVSGTKTYFSLIGTKVLVQEAGETTNVRGYYDFTKQM